MLNKFATTFWIWSPGSTLPSPPLNVTLWSRHDKYTTRNLRYVLFILPEGPQVQLHADFIFVLNQFSSRSKVARQINKSRWINRMYLTLLKWYLQQSLVTVYSVKYLHTTCGSSFFKLFEEILQLTVSNRLSYIKF